MPDAAQNTEPETEELSLPDAAQDLLGECRMVLPGIQALFGFQLIAVFNQGFSQKLSPTEQTLHLAAIGLVVVSVALVMAPASYHRQTSARQVSEQFIKLASGLLLCGMLPLALGPALDFYLIAHIILHNYIASVLLAMVILVVFFLLWVVLPRVFAPEHARQKSLAIAPGEASYLLHNDKP